ncbi:MAG: 3'(2'),5'-bisphosphate nucleotidase CysQ [Fodinibius sp.]|nr:3'(2'),5'-bisphosphate nucleotidase CysQ [Fodinibius sp.]
MIPLDGTKEFIKKNGEFTVNIALIDEGVPVLGVVYVPDKQTMYYAEKGKGSFKQFGTDSPERIFSSGSSKEDELTAVQSRSHGSDKLVGQLKEKGLMVKETVPAGSSIKFCLVAEGKADIYPRMGPTMEWDVAAGDAVYRYSAREGVHAVALNI